MTQDPGSAVQGELRLNIVADGSWTVVVCEGDLDVTTSSELRAVIQQDVECTGLVVDLDRVSFIDSTALGVLIAARKRMRRDGRAFRIVATNPTILRIFTITGLDDLFDVCSSTRAAMEVNGSV